MHAWLAGYRVSPGYRSMEYLAQRQEIEWLSIVYHSSCISQYVLSPVASDTHQVQTSFYHIILVICSGTYILGRKQDFVTSIPKTN